MSDFIIVAGVFFVLGLMVMPLRNAWIQTYGEEVKEEKHQAELEARIMEEYQPRHKASVDATHIAVPRWARSNKWRP